MIVDPPWVSPPDTLFHTARVMPDGEKPLSLRKLRFSAAITASCTGFGTSWMLMGSRFLPIRPISVPSR